MSNIIYINFLNDWNKINNKTREVFICYNVNELPELPNTITHLHCFNNKVKKISKLPINLLELEVSLNDLTELPELPNSLTKLNCSFNKIKELTLNNNIIILNCSNNELINIKNIPNSLNSLNCSNNKLTDLSELSKINDVRFYNNPLEKLPSFTDYSTLNFQDDDWIKQNALKWINDYNDIELFKYHLDKEQLKIAKRKFKLKRVCN